MPKGIKRGTCLIAIDPGSREYGVCIFVNGELVAARVFVAKKKKDKTWVQEFHTTLADFDAWIHEYTERHGGKIEVACELPEFWSGGKGGIAARGGALVKLTFATGALIQVIESMYETEVSLYPPSKWKGQTTKAQVKTRVRAVLDKQAHDTPQTGRPKLDSHCWDAAGIGLYHTGRLWKGRASKVARAVVTRVTIHAKKTKTKKKGKMRLGTTYVAW